MKVGVQMANETNFKERGLRSILRDREDQIADKQFDEFTVFQDVADHTIDHKAYDVDPVLAGDEETVAANPLMAINNQDLQGAPLEEEDVAKSKDVQAGEGDSLPDTSFDLPAGEGAAEQPALTKTASRSDIDTAETPGNAALQAPEQGGSIIVEGAAAAAGLNTAPAGAEESAAAEAQFAEPLSDDIVIVPEEGIPAEAEETTEEGSGGDETGGEDTGDEDTGGDEETTGDEGNDFTPPNLAVRVSNDTDNQTTIDSEYGFDLVPTAYGQTHTVTGADMNIPGVSDNAQISYIFHDENTLEVTLDTAWNSVKNIEISSDTAGNITVNNFVHTDVNLGEGGDSSVIINGAKRGNITTAGGNDVVEVNAQTNNAGWSNDFNIDTGAGDDTITVNGDKGVTGFNIDAGDDNDAVTITGDYLESNVHLGKGSDSFTGGDGNDFVQGGSGADIIHGGGGDDVLAGGVNRDELYGDDGNDTLKGGASSDRLFGGAGNDILDGGSGENDILTGGEGNDMYIIRAGDGHTTITDFGGVGGGGNGESALLPHHDTIQLQGDGLTADNMLLNYDGQNTVITFEGVEDFAITLENFDFTDLDNLPAVQGWNILFDGQSEGTDAYDVFNNHGTGQHSLWNANTVTHLNNADNVLDGKDNSHDVINAMDGDDVISGGTGDDVLRGQAGNDILYGDDPTDTGSSFTTTTIDVSFVSSSAGYKNAIGAYAVDTNGNILSVDVGIENAKDAQAGDTFSLEVSGPEAAGVGYFIISNGYNQNTSFFNSYDSADGTYSFLYKAGTAEERTANINDDPADVSLVFDTGSERITLSGDVYHSYEGLNSDDNDHVTASGNADGTTRLGFEDLRNLGDADFNDVVLDVSVSHETVYEAPSKDGGDDRLVGGDGDDRLIGQGGDDILEGGSGSDIAVFNGFHSEYDITFNQDGSITIADTIAGRDGTDTVSGVEYVEFRDIVLEATPEALITSDTNGDGDNDDNDDSDNDNEVVGGDDSQSGGDDTGQDDIGDETDDAGGEDDQDGQDDTGADDETAGDTDDGNNGHGNDEDGVDDSNPGQGQGGPNAGGENNGKGPGNNNGHGNNEDGVDDDNPGQGGGGPNASKDTNGDEDEGALGNQGDDTPGADMAANSFFEFSADDGQSDGQSWLAAIDDGSQDDYGQSAGAENAGQDSWLNEVDGADDDQGQNTDSADQDYDGGDADGGAGNVPVDLADIMPDASDHTGDISGSGLV